MAEGQPRRAGVGAGDRGQGGTRQALLLLRHAAVASHRGDMPLTSDGQAQAERTGGRLAELAPGTLDVRVGPTLRAQQTGQVVVDAIRRAKPSVVISGPSVASALRNPDLFLAGHRVEMVSTATAFAKQAVGVTEDEVAGLGFFAGFIGSDDRIGYWLRHADPPGDDAAAVATRVRHFAMSLRQPRAELPDVVVAITHSPVLRALAVHCLGADPGEPEYLDGYALRPLADGSCELRPWQCALAELEPWQGGE